MLAFPLSAQIDPIVFGKNVKYELYAMKPLTEDERFAIERAKKYALEQSLQNALNKQMVALKQQDLTTVKRNQALVLLSRLYVGSISFELCEEDIRNAFAPFGPIKSVTLSWDGILQKHKGFAFVEYEVPEGASLALDHLNGFTMGGRNLRVGRPSNAPQAAQLEVELREDKNTRTRIYVSAVHADLTDSDLQTVFEVFGTVISCMLIPDPKEPGRHQGYGYIEYATEEEAIAAVSSMNGFDLGGRLLRVVRAITPKELFESTETKSDTPVTTTPITKPPVPVATDDALIMKPPLAVPCRTHVSTTSSLNTIPLQSTEKCSPNETGHSTMSTSPTDDHCVSSPDQLNGDTDDVSSTSSVLMLENLIPADELDDELRAEVTDECRNYGTVVDSVIQVTDDSKVRIFVHFESNQSARGAYTALNGRFFDGRSIRAQLVDEKKFLLRQLDSL